LILSISTALSHNGNMRHSQTEAEQSVLGISKVLLLQGILKNAAGAGVFIMSGTKSRNLR